MITPMLQSPQPWAALNLSLGMFCLISFIVMFARYLAFGALAGAIQSGSRMVMPLLARMRNLNRHPRSAAQTKREILRSFRSTLVFVLGSAYIWIGAKLGWVEIYGSVSERGWSYYALALVGLLTIQDFWFYLTHRLMHHPRLFRVAHSAHHESRNIAPTVAFSFDLAEAVVQASVAPVAYSWFAVHPSHFLIFQTLMALQNFSAHLGYEWLPRHLQGLFPFSWYNSSSAHHAHHQQYRGNYGLYTRVWDRIFGTEIKSADSSRSSLAA